MVPGGAAIAARFEAAAQEAMAAGAPRQAMEVFLRGAAGDDIFEIWAQNDPVQQDRVLDNGTVFFGIDLPSFARFVPDRGAMRASGVRLTVVVGQENRENWLGAGATWLAEGSGAELVELPGGHLGFITHPEALVALVRRLIG